jgi:hypothetical protein
MQVQRNVKALAVRALATACVAIGAMIASPNAAHAGEVYLAIYYYSWTPTYSVPFYYTNSDSLGGPVSDGTYAAPANAYMFAGEDLDPLASTGPNGPNIVEESIHIYEGGPANGNASGFLTNQTYDIIVAGNHWIGQTVVPNGPTTVVITFFSTEWPTPVAPSSIPQ